MQQSELLEDIHFHHLAEVETLHGVHAMSGFVGGQVRWCQLVHVGESKGHGAAAPSLHAG